MPTSPEYHAHIMELLNQIHPVRDRKMFGGIGIFIEEGMFALITSEDVLHFKVDDCNRADFEEEGMPQFGRMPYYELPADVLESVDVLRIWMEKAMNITRNAAKK